MRFKDEFDKKIEEHAKRGYVVKQQGIYRDGYGVSEKIKYWAILVKEVKNDAV